jgi:hypothetical protein
MISFKQYIQEATIKQELTRNPTLVDPALLTLKEYTRLANKSGKSHPDEAYNWTLDKMNQFHGNPLEEYPKLVNTITKNGIVFEVRAKVIDRWNNGDRYVKYDAAGDIVRIDGEVQYYSPEELPAVITKRYQYEFGIIEKDNGKVVAVSQDEWGCVLIAVAQEYRGFGLGEVISKLTRTYQPEKDSGGFTNAGLRTFVKIHRQFVRDYVTSGKYNELIKSGQITPQRVKEIITSTELNSHKPKSKLKFDANDKDFAVDKSKWMLYTENNEFIIYDSRLKDYWQSDLDDFWMEKFFIGMIYASEGYSAGSKIVFPHQFAGINDEVKRYLLMLQLTDCKKFDEKLRLDQNAIDLLDQSKIQVESGRDRGQFLVTLTGNGIDYGDAAREEKQFRKTFDKFGEFGEYIAETAYGIFEDEGE